MKKLSTLLLVAAALSTGCASMAREVEHSELGAMNVKDERHVADTEYCSAAYAKTKATNDKEMAEAQTAYEERSIGFKTMVASIVLSHALQTGDESSQYVDACMTDKGWVTW